MYLSKITLDARHPQARKDLSSAYEMHRTLSRVFAKDEVTPPERFLWRQERGRSWDQSQVHVLVQASSPGNWEALQQWPGYVAQLQSDKAVDLQAFVRDGGRYRFRLRANPTVTRVGKRYGLKSQEEQFAWLARQGARQGFEVSSCECMDNEQQSARHSRTGTLITVQAVTFDGVLTVTDGASLRSAIISGIGHAKSLGLGLLSLSRLSTNS